MIRRILINGLGTSLIQIVAYYILTDLTHIVEELVVHGKVTDILGDLSVLLSLFLMAPMLTIQNLLAATINKENVTFVLMGIVALIYLFGWGEDLDNWPIRTIIWLTIGLSIIFVKPMIDKKLQAYFK